MADRLIAKTPEGDRLYQTGATTNPEVVGIQPIIDRRFPVDEEYVYAFGYVEYANGRRFDVPHIQSFLGRGFFEQVNSIDETLTD